MCRSKCIFLLLFSFCISAIFLNSFADKQGEAANHINYAKPAKATNHYTAANPASLRPMLTWTKVEGAVMYEIEFLRTLSPSLNDNKLADDHLFTTQKNFVNAYNPDFADFSTINPIYWRVRALDYDKNPISRFSLPEKIYIDVSLPPVQKPVPTSFFNMASGSTLLYPVYAWLPIAHATQYEVEILSAPPENPNGIDPSAYRIWSTVVSFSDAYDQLPRLSENPFYWRVRGLDDLGNPIGVYSDAGSFVVNPSNGWEIATYGDSVSHGGGHLSYSPTDWEYSYQTYLNFPTINLCNSGDTSETSVSRFEQDVLPFHPRYLIILTGTNSIRGGVSAEEVINNLKTLKAKCLENNIQPVFLTLPPINPANILNVFKEETSSNWRQNMDLVNEYIRTQNHIDLAIKMNYPGGVLPTCLSLDGLHPDISIKKKMAAIINAEWANVIEAIRKQKA